MTQNILSALNSDQVNSVGDTPESLQVAECIKSTYFNMLGRYDMPEHNQLFNLEASNDQTTPVLMYIPDGVTRLEWLDYFDTNPADGSSFQQDQFGAYSTHDVNTDLQNNAGGWSTTSTTSNTIALGQLQFTVGTGLNAKLGDGVFAIPNVSPSFYAYGTVISYDSATGVMYVSVTTIVGSGTFSAWTLNQIGPNSLNFPGYKKIEILSIEDFFRQTNHFSPAESDTQSFTLKIAENTTGYPSTFTFYYKNNIQPRYCCIVANHYIIFDAYDNTQDSTLQSSKTRAFGWVYPNFSMSDTFIPNLDAQQFPLLLNDAKSLAFSEIKNQPHQKAEEEVARQVVSLQKWKAIANKPSYFDELANFGRSGPDWSGGGRLGWR